MRTNVRKKRQNVFLALFFNNKLQIHFQCIQRILEQKGRIIQIVYRLDGTGDEDEDLVLELGEEAVEDEGINDEQHIDDIDDLANLLGARSGLAERMEAAWNRFCQGLFYIITLATANP